MKKIYLVTSGSYSDYMVNAVFSTKEIAEKYMEPLGDKYRDYRIEEFTLDPFEEEIRNGYSDFQVKMNKEGSVLEVEKNGYRGDLDDIGRTSTSFVNKSGGYVDHSRDIMVCCCYARDAEHAIKIAGEKRRMYLAQDLWGKERNI